MASAALNANQAARITNRDAKVGPNAITQVAAALRDFGGDTLARQVFSAANLLPALSEPPTAMIDQRMAAKLHTSLRRTMEPHDAAVIAIDAGCRTADYLLANRIPRPAQWLMKALPARPAASILLKAMAANAWTFAGTGIVRTTPGDPCKLDILNNPLAQPGCPWHIGVFETLFQTLVSKNARVSHTCCCAHGASTCRFEITLS